MTAPAEGRLAGRVAVVTGAGSGNGAATAARLVADGATVIYFDLDGDADEKQTAEASAPDRAILVVGDITSDADIARALRKVDRLDILVNNAGIVLGAKFPDPSVESSPGSWT